MSALDGLLQAKAITRPLRTYAYLTSSIRAQQGTPDALECLVPFVVAGVAEQGDGDPLDDVVLQTYLQSFGLSIPLFVLGQIKRRLVDMGVLEWSVATKRHIVRKARAPDQQEANSVPLEDVFDAIEGELGAFAASVGSNGPHSASWSDALIAFLKSDTLLHMPGLAKDRRPEERPFMIRDTMMGKPEEAEQYIVASFIEHSKVERDQSLINGIIQVYSGILIEEFISSVQSAGQVAGFRSLNIYYDTPLLLRLLGTSGHVLQSAVQEIHTTLGALGCSRFCLPSTRSELKRILTGIADGTGTVHRETMDALTTGEVSMLTIQELAVTFETVLKEDFKITPLRSIKAKGPHIRENDLARELFAEANNRSYLFKTAENDARAIAAIVQLRGGYVTDGVSDSRHLLISRNPLLHRVVREFMMQDDHQDYEEDSVPPVLTIGQIATVAWLSQPQKLEASGLGRDLLARCYNAVRPRPDWIRKYARIIDRYAKKDAAFAQSIADDAMFVGTFSRLVRDVTVGEPVLLDRLDDNNMTRLVAEAERTVAELQGDLDRTRSEKAASERELALADKAAQDEKRQLEERARSAEEAARMAEERRLVAEEEAKAARTQLAAVPETAGAESTDDVAPQDERRFGHEMHALYVVLIIITIIICGTVGAYLVQSSRFAMSVWLTFVVAVLALSVSLFAVYRRLSVEDFMQVFRISLSAIPGRSGAAGRPQAATAPGGTDGRRARRPAKPKS